MTSLDAGPAWAPGYRHLTAELRPIPLQLREVPEDFEVEEDAQFAPEEAGEHLYLWIEKRGVATRIAIRRLARALGVAPRDFGYAGLKDARAVTRQWLSIAGVPEERVQGLELEGVRVLRWERHTRKLRVGQLRGNRFVLVLRGIEDADRVHVAACLAKIERDGLPNYFGAQRFGRRGRTHELGRLLLQGDPEAYVRALVAPEHAGDGAPAARLAELVEGDAGRGARAELLALIPELDSDLRELARQLARRPGDWASALRAIPKSTCRFQLNALQSRAFNRVLAARMAWPQGLADLRPGDLACFHDGRGSIFRVEDPVEAERARSFDLSPTGPLAGSRAERAEGEPGALEGALLAEEGLSPEALERLSGGLRLSGARRPLRVRVEGLDLAWESQAARLSFRLPSGSYATTLIEELRKDHAPRLESEQAS